MKDRRSLLFEQLILKSWWVFLFFLVAFFCFDQAVRRKEREEQRLQQKLAYLLQTKQEAEQRQAALKQEISSQKDPRWIEIVLRRKLGLAAEGETKVYFK